VLEVKGICLAWFFYTVGGWFAPELGLAFGAARKPDPVRTGAQGATMKPFSNRLKFVACLFGTAAKKLKDWDLKH